MKLNSLDELDKIGKIGDWVFLEQDTRIAIRYSENAFAGTVIIPISGEYCWKWDNNKDEPTITPSILVRAVPGWTDGWHGFLTNGKLITV